MGLGSPNVLSVLELRVRWTWLRPELLAGALLLVCLLVAGSSCAAWVGAGEIELRLQVLVFEARSVVLRGLAGGGGGNECRLMQLVCG